MIDVPVNVLMPHAALLVWWPADRAWITYADYVFRVARTAAPPAVKPPRQARLQFGRKENNASRT